MSILSIIYCSSKQHKMLSIKLRGHYQYYGVIGNIRLLGKVVHRARRYWRYWLSRRSHKSDNIADVSNQLGHFSETFTMKIYYHWMPGKKKSEVDELDDQEFKDRKEANDKNRRAV